MSLRVRQDRLLNLAPEEVVRRLQRLDRNRGAKGLHLGGVEVRDPDVAHLPLGDELCEGAGRFLEGRGRIRPVHLVQVDVVGAERLQAFVGALTDPGGTGVALDAATGGRPQPTLGGEEHLVAAPSLDGPRQQALGRPEPIALGGVEERHTLVGGSPDGGDGLSLVGSPPVTAQLPRPEGQSGDDPIAASKSGPLHRRLLLCVPSSLEGLAG